jgi:adenylyl-sulfate kinase
MSDPQRQVVPVQGKVDASMRAAVTGQQPVTVWLTGLSGAGKSTLAVELERRLIDARHPALLLDGDNLRTGLSRDLGFKPADRHENIRRVAEVARLVNDAGVVAIAAFISPYRADREMARAVVGEERFMEVHVSAPLEVCERRDPKGMYRKARRGELPEFTGVSAPYEAPERPALVVDTGDHGVDECSAQLLAAVRSRIQKRP